MCVTEIRTQLRQVLLNIETCPVPSEQGLQPQTGV